MCNDTSNCVASTCVIDNEQLKLYGDGQMYSVMLHNVFNHDVVNHSSQTDQFYTDYDSLHTDLVRSSYVYTSTAPHQLIPPAPPVDSMETVLDTFQHNNTTYHSHDRATVLHTVKFNYWWSDT